MPLHILLILVVAGIGGIALLLHLTGHSAEARLDRDSVVRAWARHYPDDRVLHVRVADNGRAALVRTDTGPGLIRAFGADTVARHLQGTDLHDTDTGLRIDFHDYTSPPVTLALSAQECAQWRAEMEATA